MRSHRFVQQWCADVFAAFAPMSPERKFQQRSDRRQISGYRGPILAGCALLVFAALFIAILVGPAGAEGTSAALGFDHTRQRVKDFDINLTKSPVSLPTASQLNALQSLKASLNDNQVTVRWDKTTGSLDVVYDFASASSSADPESAARTFIASNAALFGINDLATLRLKSNVECFGGNLLYFEQLYSGLPVATGGIGVVMDGARRIRMLSGPYFTGLTLDTTPGLDASAAIARAQLDLAKYKLDWNSAVAAVMNPAMDQLAAELGVLATPHPQLNVYPTPSGARLAYEFYLFSRNPFGYFHYQIDAIAGDILLRADQVRYQQPLPFTADVYPSSPVLANPDTGELAVDGNGPQGMLRVQLRNYNPGMNATAVEGTMSGPNALVRNLLASKQPFAQAAAGTFHFRQNNPPLEAQPNEQDDLAEPAQQIDMVNNFFFINYLMEYIKHIHIAGDRVHSTFGPGHFPDSFPNSDKPLVGLVHFPSDQGLAGISGPPDFSSPDALLRSALGMDNAFSLSTTQNVAGQQIVINPTAYGHGYLFNDLAKDGPVVYHEGMHSISTPIAGLRAAPEGGAINEGQADLWAYTITEDKVLGNYVVNGHRLRAATRAAGGNPDLRQWIRHADSGLTYSQLGTRFGNQFAVHRDGEIYASTMHDIRELVLMFQTGGPHKRPNFITGSASDPIPLGQDTWERLLLGQIYILGTMEPDTFVRTRDALIMADQFLYPSDPLDPQAPGLHRALIEQVYAGHEIGANAAAPVGGRQTISTQVSEFATSQNKTQPPTGVTAEPASTSSVRVSWQPVSGAFAYEVMKRQIGKENQRQNAPVAGREYFDGDPTTDGYLHVDYVNANQTAYVDNGPIISGSVRLGLSNPASFEYVVRALSRNPNKQVGVSDLSAAASMPTAALDVTSKVQTAIVDGSVSFANGSTEFELTLKNNGAGAFDGTIYMPIAFQIVSISDPSIRVLNADNGGTGQAGSPAAFYFRQTLLRGQTSEPRQLTFANPNTRLFTIQVVITGRVQVDPAASTRWEPEPPPTNLVLQEITDLYTGVVPAMDRGALLTEGLTYIDIPFTGRDRVISLTGKLSSPTADTVNPLTPGTPVGGLDVDLDLYLYDALGSLLAASESATSNETVVATIKPRKNYFYRVVGWQGAATEFRLESKQSVLSLEGGGSSNEGVSAPAGSGTGALSNFPAPSQFVRFTINPLTKTVNGQLVTKLP